MAKFPKATILNLFSSTNLGLKVLFVKFKKNRTCAAAHKPRKTHAHYEKRFIILLLQSPIIIPLFFILTHG
jgi:hypothetical protein